MSESCPTCGQPVRVVSSDEGTSHYEAAARYGPLEPAHQEAARLRRGLERIHRIGTHPAKNAALRLEQLEEIAGIADYALALLTEPDTATDKGS